MKENRPFREASSLILKKDQGGADLITEAVSPVPVTGGVVAGFVAVPVFDPRAWAAFGAVGDRPC